ncbi:TPA: extensin, partial [Pseudomonas putida]
MRALLALLASLLTVAGLAWHFGWRLPAAWNPWAPLDVRQPPNLLTPYKLSRLRDDPALCRQALETSHLRYRAQADSPASANCPLQNVWRIEGGLARLSSSFLASCPLAVAYALFE